jgi:hypothetical protein
MKLDLAARRSRQTLKSQPLLAAHAAAAAAAAGRALVRAAMMTEAESRCGFSCSAAAVMAAAAAAGHFAVARIIRFRREHDGLDHRLAQRTVCKTVF